MQPINEISPSSVISELSLPKTKSLSSLNLKIKNYFNISENSKDQNESNQVFFPKKYHLTLLNDTDEYLGYKKVYNTQYCQNDDKEEKDDKDSNESENYKLSNTSNIPSRTTQAESNVSSTTPTYNCYRNDRISFFTNTRKMSSPLCSYYNSSHKFLSELLEKNMIDYSKSNNYIEKDSFLNNNTNDNIFNSYIPPQQKSSKALFRMYGMESLEKKEEFETQQRKNSYGEYNNENTNTKINQNNSEFSPNIPLQLNSNQMLNFSIFCQKNINNVNNVMNTPPYSKTNSINENKNMNFRQFQLNPSSINNNNPNERKKHNRPFTERAGDWVCYKCKNLNFAFRLMCNRCHLPKNESEKMGENNKKNNSNNNIKNNNNCNNNIL